MDEGGKGIPHTRTLMLLGGSRHQLCAIEAARRVGYRTVLCDYLGDNPGQHVADMFYLESTTDRQRMLQIARRERIDGIISFGSDAANPSAAFVAERLGLPTNPLAAVEILSDKGLVRPYLRAHGFFCPRSASFPADLPGARLLDVCEDMAFPVVVKPTDSSGSKGVSVVDDPNEDGLDVALASARRFSRNGVLCVEELIRYGYPRLIGGDIFVQGGEVCFWGLMDCLRDDRLGGLVPVGKAYPTSLGQGQMRVVRSELQRLVSSLGLRFGEMNVEVILAPGDVPYILELGARAGGNMIPVQLEDISGIDLAEASVRAAMGDEPMDVHFDGNEDCVATSVLHALSDGSFTGVEYAPELREHIYREMIYVRHGARVERLENGSQAIGVIFLRFDTPDQMRELMSRVGDLVRVIVA